MPEFEETPLKNSRGNHQGSQESAEATTRFFVIVSPVTTMADRGKALYWGTS